MKVLSHYRRALRYVRPYWPVALGSIVGTATAVGVGLLTPWPMKILVDSVLGNESLPTLLRFIDPWAADKRTVLVLVVAAGFAIALISGALDVLTTYLNTKLEIAMMLSLIHI